MLEVRDEQGRTWAKSATFGRDELELFFNWRPEERYFLYADGRLVQSAIAPAAKPFARVRLHIPLGQHVSELELFPNQPDQSKDVQVPLGLLETIDILLEVELLEETKPIEFGIRTYWLAESCPAATTLAELPWPPEWRFQLNHQFDKAIRSGQFKLKDETLAKKLLIDISTVHCTCKFRVTFVPSEKESQDIEVVAWTLPTDNHGRPETGLARDRIVLTTPYWQRLGTLLGLDLRLPSYYDPYTYQTLHLKNNGDYPICLLVTSEILDPQSGRPVSFFRSPELDSTGGSPIVAAYGCIAPGETQKFVLPVYVRPGTPAGFFLRRVTVKPMGSDRILLRLEHPLTVIRSNLGYTLWFFFAIGLGIIWFAVGAVFYRRIIESFGVRALVLLSLLGSIQFGLQFFSQIVLTFFYALLGPFNCLVGGLFSEISHYLVLTAILCLVPRVGAVTLASLVSFLLGTVMFGSFGILELLFVFSAASMQELLLFMFGATSCKGKARLPSLPSLMLALGIADAAATLTSLTLQAVFYRLFFATWYILLQVVVTGFLYTCIGVYLGRQLGASLRSVEL